MSNAGNADGVRGFQIMVAMRDGTRLNTFVYLMD
jgi:predicted acyl esterase